MDLSFYQNKKVLVTGHTGFKGSWLTKILLMAGAEVLGYSLDPPTDPALFYEIGLTDKLKERSVKGDVRDLPRLLKAFSDFQPEIVFHLAAQPIVRASYEEPVYTYETNVMGTVNVLECIRLTDSVKSALIITTDKVYENRENNRAYEEDDKLDGYDPYSNSKSCAELCVHSYKKSFLDGKGIAVSTARAGNVIGGGDYARDRIIPDCVRAGERREPIVLRNPYSTRPYQHVLEPLSAYLKIAAEGYLDPKTADYYNVGPDEKDSLETGHIADLFCEAWGEGLTWNATSANGPHEANYLRLNHEKITKTFGWVPVWDVKKAVEMTVAYQKATEKEKEAEREIRAYFGEEKACLSI